ncbi:MAG TPA: DUF397 domain-containing protein [Streptosporangiaceae bacterium]|jgi:hypothetical protein
MKTGDDASTSPWRKSARCGANAGCVEVARLASKHIGVRDSKIVATSPILSFNTQEWRSFLGTIKTGRLDLT